MTERLIVLFKQMSDLTAPECAIHCKIPHSCCAPEYCDEAENWARMHGVELQRTGHAKLKFMSSTGCTVPPHLRPSCTLHTCDVNSFGVKHGDVAWTEQYFKLRDEIDEQMWSEMR